MKRGKHVCGATIVVEDISDGLAFELYSENGVPLAGCRCPECGGRISWLDLKMEQEQMTKEQVDVFQSMKRTAMSGDRHWTADSLENMRFSIVFDALVQLGKQGLNPLRTGMKKLVRLCHIKGRKMTILIYENNDPRRGPINPAVFLGCWEALGRPKDGFDLEKSVDDFRKRMNDERA